MSTRTRTRTKISVATTLALAAGGLTAVVANATAASPGQTAASTAIAEPPVLTAELVRTYDAFDANQGVAVDGKSFYAVDNRSITKHDRESGEPLLQIAGSDGGPLIHMDSGAVVGGKIYAAHSNYSGLPMQSSVEVFDARTMRHLATHSFGVERGSMTWLDRHDGSWWAGFANYDILVEGKPYGETDNTQIVQLDDRFNVVEAYNIPQEILDRFKPMSNSGGSWGPDGRLWLSGHDLGEAYVMELPEAGAELRWIATVELPGVEGQGIAWDRSGRGPTLWTIQRSTKQVKQFAVPYRDIEDPGTVPWQVLGPGEFDQ
jgi:hypothetical protein